MVVQSKIKFTTLSWAEATLYLLLTNRLQDLSTLDPNLLPTRKFKTGPAPSITTEEIMGPMARDLSKSKFNPPRRSPNTTEQGEILGLVLRTDILTSMSHHHYKFAEKIYLQVKGGPIGDLFAQAGCRLVMTYWDQEFRVLISSQNLYLNATVIQRYVDDLNLKTGALPVGAYWDNTSRQICIKSNPTEEDAAKPADLRTAEVVREMANSVCDMFTWTLDCPSLNPNNNIPVLNVQIWC